MNQSDGGIKGSELVVKTRLAQAEQARNSLAHTIKNSKKSGDDVSSLEKMLKAYNRDIAGYKKTLGMK